MCIIPFHVKNGGCERRYPWTGRQAGHGRQAVHSCIQLLVNHSFFSIHAFIQLKQSLLNHSTICFSFIQLFIIHSFNYSLFIHSTIRYLFILLFVIHSFHYPLLIHNFTSLLLLSIHLPLFHKISMHKPSEHF